MPYRKEHLKYSAVSAVIGSLLWLILDQIYIALDFGGYFVPHLVSLSLGVFLGVFLVLGIIGKSQKPSFSLALPVFLIFFVISFTIRLIEEVIFYTSVPFPLDMTLYEFLLQFLEYAIPPLAVFSLIGITAGIIMVRLASKLKYDSFYFVFASLIGVGAGTILMKFSWMVRMGPSYPPLLPYLPLFALIGTLMGIIIIQIALLRKRPPSNFHTCISITFWIIAFIIIVFNYEWVIYVHPPWF